MVQSESSTFENKGYQPYLSVCFGCPLVSSKALQPGSQFQSSAQIRKKYYEWPISVPLHDAFIYFRMWQIKTSSFNNRWKWSEHIPIYKTHLAKVVCPAMWAKKNVMLCKNVAKNPIKWHILVYHMNDWGTSTHHCRILLILHSSDTLYSTDQLT